MDEWTGEPDDDHLDELTARVRRRRCPLLLGELALRGRVTAEPTLSADDLAVDRELADIAGGFRFLLDLTPVDLVEARRPRSSTTGAPPAFEYRPLEDDPAVAAKRLAEVRGRGRRRPDAREPAPRQAARAAPAARDARLPRLRRASSP